VECAGAEQGARIVTDTTLPAPPYPADTRAKGWRFEIDHERIFDQSETWSLASSELKPWLLMLWLIAWRQTPCGSLPDDDELIAAKIGMAPKTYEKHRRIILRGWWKAKDGRLYHDTITTRVLAMLGKRANDAERAANRRARTLESSASHSEVTRDSQATPSGLHREFDTKHQAPSTLPQQDKPVGERAKRAARKCPRPFGVDDDMRRWAAETVPGVSVERETAKFLDHTFKTAITDWRGAWRNWLRKAAEFAPRVAVVPINRQEAIEQRNRAVGEEWLRQQEAADARQ
jgi:hypothetical protein